MREKVRYEVPFFGNDNNRCAVVTNRMVLAYFEPAVQLSQSELDGFTGYIEGLGSWGIESALGFARRGYDVVWIEEFDFDSFANDAVGYMRRKFGDGEKLQWQLEHSDISKEQERARDYRRFGLPFENRKGTIDDIRGLLDKGYLVKLGVNGERLMGKEGYIGHMVLVVGYDEESLIVHNAYFDPIPNQRVTDQVLYSAWEDFSGGFWLQAFRLSGETVKH